MPNLEVELTADVDEFQRRIREAKVLLTVFALAIDQATKEESDKETE